MVAGPADGIGNESHNISSNYLLLRWTFLDMAEEIEGGWKPRDESVRGFLLANMARPLG